MTPMRQLPALAMAALLTLGAARAEAQPESYKIDPEHLSIGFLVDHIGYAKVLGLFREVEGSFRFDREAGHLSDLTVTIKSASVYTAHDKRDEHLRGPDFLNAGEFPEITFTMTGSAATGERTGTVTGNLRLLGVSRPVTLEVTWNKSGEYPFGGGLLSKPNFVTGISARGSFRRSDFGMMYAVENGWVGDIVDLIIEAEAIRQ
ncbi:MAG: YceI family protein [Oceanibaculum sp.]